MQVSSIRLQTISQGRFSQNGPGPLRQQETNAPQPDSVRFGTTATAPSRQQMYKDELITQLIQGLLDDDRPEKRQEGLTCLGNLHHLEFKAFKQEKVREIIERPLNVNSRQSREKGLTEKREALQLIEEHHDLFTRPERAELLATLFFDPVTTTMFHDKNPYSSVNAFIGVNETVKLTEKVLDALDTKRRDPDFLTSARALLYFCMSNSPDIGGGCYGGDDTHNRRILNKLLYEPALWNGLDAFSKKFLAETVAPELGVKPPDTSGSKNAPVVSNSPTVAPPSTHWDWRALLAKFIGG